MCLPGKKEEKKRVTGFSTYYVLRTSSHLTLFSARAGRCDLQRREGSVINPRSHCCQQGSLDPAIWSQTPEQT